MTITPKRQAPKFVASKSGAKPRPAAKAPAATAKAKRVRFSLRTAPGCKVFLTGTFNNWEPTAIEMADKRVDGNYAATLSLAPGKHLYKFVVDGTWCCDPECQELVPNAHGTLDCVKRVL